MIAITGIGVLSSFGVGQGALVDGLGAGRAGYGEPELFDFGVSPVGEVRGFRAKDFMTAMKARRMSRFSQLSLCSAIQAVEDSGLDLEGMDRLRCAVVCGTGLASTGSTDEFFTGLMANGPADTNPILFPETVPNIAASQIAIHFGISGPNTTFSHNEISAELALSYAMDLLASGAVDAAIVSGSDELNEAVIKGYSYLGFLGDGMRVFDPDSRGFVLSEGGASVVLERLDDARRRGAEVYAEIASLSLCSRPTEHLHYDRSSRSMVAAMKTAIGSAGADDVDMVSASANAVVEHDSAEAAAIAEILPEEVPVVAPRAFTGFFIADGILRLAATALCMREGLLPGIGTSEGRIRHAVMNSFSSGGSAASAVLRSAK